MDVPLQIAFKDMDSDPEMEAEIRRKVDWLRQFSKHIVSCRVAVEMPHKRSRNGNLYNLKIHITMPAGGDIAVDRDPPIDAHQYFPAASRDAFNSARRQLEKWEREHGQRERRNDSGPNGRIADIHRQDGYGFIAALDGREIYFHRNSVGGDGFDSLEVGNPVQFSETEGDKGPQATFVEVLHRGQLD